MITKKNISLKTSHYLHNNNCLWRCSMLKILNRFSLSQSSLCLGCWLTTLANSNKTFCLSNAVGMTLFIERNEIFLQITCNHNDIYKQCGYVSVGKMATGMSRTTPFSQQINTGGQTSFSLPLVLNCCFTGHVLHLF